MTFPEVLGTLLLKFARLAQLVRAPRLHRGGQGFESLGVHSIHAEQAKTEGGVSAVMVVVPISCPFCGKKVELRINANEWRKHGNR